LRGPQTGPEKHALACFLRVELREILPQSATFSEKTRSSQIWGMPVPAAKHSWVSGRVWDRKNTTCFLGYFLEFLDFEPTSSGNLKKGGSSSLAIFIPRFGVVIKKKWYVVKSQVSVGEH